MLLLSMKANVGGKCENRVRASVARGEKFISGQAKNREEKGQFQSDREESLVDWCII